MVCCTLKARNFWLAKLMYWLDVIHWNDSYLVCRSALRAHSLVMSVAKLMMEE